jgi:hypothetical protein
MDNEIYKKCVEDLAKGGKPWCSVKIEEDEP